MIHQQWDPKAWAERLYELERQMNEHLREVPAKTVATGTIVNKDASNQNMQVRFDVLQRLDRPKFQIKSFVEQNDLSGFYPGAGQ